MPTFVPPHDGFDKRAGSFLPHWRQDHATYFVTFRLADALPVSVINALLAERDQLATNARQHRTEDAAREIERTYLRRYHAYLDRGEGDAWMRDPKVADIVSSALKFFDGKRYDLWAWCVMPNHVHAVVQPKPAHELGSILHSWRSFSAKQVNAEVGRSGQLWQREPFDHVIRSYAKLWKYVRYTVRNPELARLPNWKWMGAVEMPAPEAR